MNEAQTELVPHEPESQALTRHAYEKPAPTVAGMLQAVIEKGVTSENVDALGKLCDLYERMEDRGAKKQFAAAFKALQSELPNVEPTKSVPNNDGTVRYKYAPYDELMGKVGPIMAKHGFTASFSTKFSDGRVTCVCTLMHDGGHERSNEYSVRIGKGPPGSSESQADGAANQYAQRGALMDCLNIVVRGRDNDARDLGASISVEQAKSLEQRVKETGSDREKFLKFAGAVSFDKISATRYATLDEMLRKRERTPCS